MKQAWNLCVILFYLSQSVEFVSDQVHVVSRVTVLSQLALLSQMAVSPKMEIFFFLAPSLLNIQYTTDIEVIASKPMFIVACRCRLLLVHDNR